MFGRKTAAITGFEIKALTFYFIALFPIFFGFFHHYDASFPLYSPPTTIQPFFKNILQPPFNNPSTIFFNNLLQQSSSTTFQQSFNPPSPIHPLIIFLIGPTGNISKPFAIIQIPVNRFRQAFFKL